MTLLIEQLSAVKLTALAHACHRQHRHHLALGRRDGALRQLHTMAEQQLNALPVRQLIHRQIEGWQLNPHHQLTALLLIRPHQVLAMQPDQLDRRVRHDLASLLAEQELPSAIPPASQSTWPSARKRRCPSVKVKPWCWPCCAPVPIHSSSSVQPNAWRQTSPPSIFSRIRCSTAAPQIWQISPPGSILLNADRC
jgi:hypothetical protein